MIVELRNPVHDGRRYGIEDPFGLIEAAGLALRNRYGDVYVLERGAATP